MRFNFKYLHAHRIGYALAVSCSDFARRLEADVTSLLQDLRFAIRHMRRSPGFAFTAVVVLALGIAANVIVFGVLQALILKPLDVPNPDRVMTFAPHAGDYPIFAYPEVRDVRDGNTVFSAVAADTIDFFGLEAAEVTRPVWGYEVSGQYFEVVAIKPYLGRLLERADDDHPGASEVAVITFGAWKNYFGSDPNIVGKTVGVNKHPYTIVGVTPEGFYGTEKFLQPDIFVPMANVPSLHGVNWLESRRDKTVFPIVRIKDGITLTQVQAELDTIAARIRQQYPNEEDRLEYKLARAGMVGDFLGGAARRFLAGVMALAGIVLLAACANLGGLFAARTADRAREIAIRLAVGSSRWHVVRQVMVEAVVVSTLGGAIACGLAWVALGALAKWHPPTDYPMRFVVEPQPSLVLVALLVSVLAVSLPGVMPLRQIFKADPNDAIKRGGYQAGASRRWALRDVLLAAQIALCCVTITAAFVSLRGLARTMTVDLGFNPKNAVLTTFDLSQEAYSKVAADQFQQKLQERLLQLPGVEAVGYANTTNMTGDNSVPAVFSQQTSDFRPSNAAFNAFEYDVSPGYLAACATPLLAGRDVSFNDTPTAPAVAVVNQEFVRRLFHIERARAGDAVGRYFKDGAGANVQIVGIAADGKQFLVSETPRAAEYFPISQRPNTKTSLVVRIKPGAATTDMAATVRNMIRDLDAAVPVRTSADWRSQLAMSFFPAQVATVALGLFGAFGLLLSITGTFGLASYTVSKRTRELSIRVALGAQQVLAAALGRMLLLLAGGSLVGLLLGVAASKVLSVIVFQASAQDPIVLSAVALTILITGCLSVAGPVRRALRVDPANVLRDL
jgi:predicted permease